jgi:hypothetical protein
MKRLIILCAFGFLAFACNPHENLVRPTWDIATFGDGQFKQLTIVWEGAVSPEYVKSQIDVTSDKVLTLNMEYYKDDLLQDQCTGSATLKDQDYEKIASMSSSSNLFHYQPMGDCKPMYGTQGVSITYTRSDGVSNHFNTLCDLEPLIDSLLLSIDALAHTNVTDCSWELLTQENSETPASGT